MDTYNKSLADLLDEVFPLNQSVNPSSLCSRIEDLLLEEIVETVTESIEKDTAKNDQSFTHVGAAGFAIDKHVYVLRLRAERTFLHIDIDSQAPPAGRWPAKRKSSSKVFNSPGRYSGITIKAPKLFVHLFKEILFKTINLLTEGYRWLENRVLWSLGDTREKLSAELYLFVKTRIPEKHASLVWFFVLTDSHGSYLVDNNLLSRSLQELSISDARIHSSPLELLSQMVNVSLPTDDTHSIDSIKERAILAMDLNSPKYADTGLQVAEIAVFKCNHLLVHPLVHERNAYLTVGYPPDLADALTPFFDLNKDRIRDIVLRNKSAINQTIEKIRQQGALPEAAGVLANLFGHFVRGLGDLPNYQGT